MRIASVTVAIIATFSVVHGGEAVMLLHGPSSEPASLGSAIPFDAVMPFNDVQGLQRRSSADAPDVPAPSPRAALAFRLPPESAGAKSRIRIVSVDADHSTGVLNFNTRNADIPGADEIEIPGLMLPEILATDMCSLVNAAPRPDVQTLPPPRELPTQTTRQ